MNASVKPKSGKPARTAGKQRRNRSAGDRPVNRRRYYDVRQYAMLFNAAGELLVLQLPLHYQPYGGMWTFPGGKLEPRDVPEEGILREIKEETCLQAKIKGVVHLDRWDTERSRKLAIFYHCELVGDAATPVLSEEHRSARWVNQAELQELEFYSEYFSRALEALTEKN